MNGLIQEPLNPNLKTELIQEEDVGLRAVRLANAVAFPMVLKAALELGVIDVIHAAGDGVYVSPAAIARRLPTKPNNPQAPMLLDRMLRLLASYSIVKCRTVRTGEVEMVYAAEPICRFLLNDNEGSGSLASLFMLQHDDVFIKTWSQLKDVILEGGDAFIRAHNMKLFEYTGRDQRLNKLFNRAMSESTILLMKRVVEVYPGFQNVKVLVDVGGGVGSNLSIIVSKYPHMKGINFDLAVVLADAPSFSGVEHVAGDMFVQVPKGDAIFMKGILHDWNDEDSIKILKNCWKALPNKGKVILVQTVVPDEPQSDDIFSNIVHGMDMLMLAQCSGGKERTRAEVQYIAKESGFSRCQFICRVYSSWAIELHKDAETDV